jgi:hypothetical protein
VIEAERPKPGCRTARAVVEPIRELAQHHPDDQIASISPLNGRIWQPSLEEVHHVTHAPDRSTNRNIA